MQCGRMKSLLFLAALAAVTLGSTVIVSWYCEHPCVRTEQVLVKGHYVLFPAGKVIIPVWSKAHWENDCVERK
jgi:hypothetical protein